MITGHASVMPSAVWLSRHIQVDLLFRYLPRLPARALSTAIDAIRIAFFAYTIRLVWIFIDVTGDERMTTGGICGSDMHYFRRGVTLTLHSDDPPRPLFDLPRIASTAEDYQALFDAVPSKANGICLCTGSLGVRAENDLPAMAERFAPRIDFAHLRATRCEADGLSFHESDHLDGDVDMIAVLKALLIVFRPDHSHRMLDDLATTKRTNRGYTAIGRLRGSAESRGAIRAIEHDRMRAA